MDYPEKGTVIYNGVSEEYYTGKNVQKIIIKMDTKFLISGALQPGKGQDCAIRGSRHTEKTGNYKF